ncbi:MAG: transposase [Opitutus sp.]|nr:transposase [Opitutus sp.]MCS6243334.1 transposase [Opitutus sp.]MCS6244862.1 transposase [Opitutus sp.]MCS6277118.1 transposase [Opitutus sp.]MCS6279075.1 transposase [Opitutus sp.]
MKTGNKISSGVKLSSNESIVYPSGDFFSTPARSDFGDFLLQLQRFWRSHPEIEVAMTADLDAHAMAEKRERRKDREFELAQTEALFAVPASGTAEKTQAEFLAAGRPRTPAVVVFITAMATGYLGSQYSACPRMVLLESASLRTLLDDLGYTLPAPNTVGPLINRLSESTLALIHRAQLADILAEGLDSFTDITLDSTAIKASSCWPTDSGIIYRLFERAYRMGGKLDQVGLNSLQDGFKDHWLEELRKSARAIALLGGGPRRAQKLRLLYDQFYQIACKLGGKLLTQVEAAEAEANVKLAKLRPSKRRIAEDLLDCIHGDVVAVITTIQQSIARVHDGVKTKSRERVLSLADRSAAFIEKGGREPVIGYKPQLARSRGGFVTALILDAGNVADCKQLVPLLIQNIANTGLVPASANVDDGYSSAEGLAQAYELKVAKVSISGAKGRALLGEELWNHQDYITLRAERSAIESLMFTLKFNHGFGRPGRRGLAAVRSELTLKILAHNFDRMILVRARRSQEKPLPLAA